MMPITTYVASLECVCSVVNVTGKLTVHKLSYTRVYNECIDLC